MKKVIFFMLIMITTLSNYNKFVYTLMYTQLPLFMFAPSTIYKFILMINERRNITSKKKFKNMLYFDFIIIYMLLLVILRLWILSGGITMDLEMIYFYLRAVFTIILLIKYNHKIYSIFIIIELFLFLGYNIDTLEIIIMNSR